MVSAILEGKPDKNLILVTGRTHPKLASDVAEQLGIDILETTAYDFANGEMYVRYTEPVRGADAFVMQAHTEPINKWIMEQLIMVDAMKRASARSITVVAPFLGYSRQDKKHQGREPITARLMFDLFRSAGADRIMTVDLHAAQEQGFFDGPVDHLTAMPILLEPIYHVEVDVPDQYMGDVIGDLNKRRGRIMGMNPLDGGKQEIVAECPMAELGDYAIKLRSMTQGRGSFVSQFERYDEAPAPVQEKVIAANKARLEALNKE